MALACLIRWHVQSLDHEVRREGLASTSVVACRNFLVDTIDVETGVRGYLITGRKEYLRPYHEGLGRITDDTAKLRVAVGRDMTEYPYLLEVLRLSREVLSEFVNQVDASEQRGIEAGRTRFIEYPTKPNVDRVREALLSIQAEEDRRMRANLASLDRTMNTTVLLLNIYIIVLGLILVAMAAGFISPPVPSPKGPRAPPHHPAPTESPG